MSFERFWSMYPKRVARKAAERAWNKLNPTLTLIETILDDIEKRVKSHQWRKDGGQFVPFPASYLNGARWEDEDDASPIPPGKFQGLQQFVERGEG